ncbi:glutathione S-transferase family protein [uncultured Vibrio sp.]|uniref:glutathione S-transferase family protein n=1 Tax=uncultured Vibrio sp. TaxID=114054 RepID=UPI0009104CA4|nr:glutathione S-transferase family protein [uncultured Vibrio sp.]OIQ26563.1 MAG: glutathione S-transferase [Vibrio sp. MedPE-SWchi]
MYTLYFTQGACSVATQVILRELGQEVELVDAQQYENFKSINPAGAVPVLVDGDKTLTEGAAIILYLLNKHENSLLPTNVDERQAAVQDIMFANATMHPAYGRLFFLSQYVSDETAKNETLNAAADIISQLWEIVEAKLEGKPFLGGGKPSVADILLSVYSRWGNFFPVDIKIGDKTQAMLNKVQAMPNFIKTDDLENSISGK